LHVEISALGPPAEAHARIAYALAEVRKFLIPDANDTIRQEQLREILSGEAGQEVAERVRNKMAPRMQHPQAAHPPAAHPPPPTVVQTVPPRTNVHSILERARISMEESRRYEEHGHHEAGPPQHTYQPHPHAYDPRYQNPVPNGPQAHPPPGNCFPLKAF
jgi:KH domain-containing RNA-binding signal transduction-associated protein 3